MYIQSRPTNRWSRRGCRRDEAASGWEATLRVVWGERAWAAARLNSTVSVRHEVVQVAVGAATSLVLAAMLQDSTRRSAAGILPRRASSGKPSPLGRWRGAKPSGQKRPSSYGMVAKSREDVATANTKRSGARIAWRG
jgi:hypothetical protein